MILQYFLYPVSYMFLLGTLGYASFSRRMALGDFVQYVLLDWPTLVWGVPLMLFFLWWYAGDKVVLFEYDANTRMFTVLYYNRFFSLKKQVISAESLRYQIFHTVAPIIFRGKVCIYIVDMKTMGSVDFSSGFGWKQKQVNEIADRMKRILPPTV